jgi:iron complex transport system ATP-binding protein
MNCLSVKQLTVKRDSRNILHAVECTVDGGSITAIIGPNGAGKSTLLKVLSGEWRTEEGEIRINNIPLTTIDAQTRAQNIAVLPQHSTLNFPFSVEEVVMLGRIPHRTGNAIDKDIVNQALLQLDLVPLRSRLYPELSGGEKQRVQLARVLAQLWRTHDSAYRILLLDEPLSALDLMHQQLLLRLLRQFAQEKMTILFTVHDLNIASCYADTVLVIDNGALIAQGKSREVLTHQLVQSVFKVSLINRDDMSRQHLFFL